MGFAATNNLKLAATLGRDQTVDMGDIVNHIETITDDGSLQKQNYHAGEFVSISGICQIQEVGFVLTLTSDYITGCVPLFLHTGPG